MDETIRRRALRSAAKVAFGATLCWGAGLAGCGGKSVYGSEDGSAETRGGTAENPELACTGPLGSLEPRMGRAWDAEALACCIDYVSSTRADGGPLPDTAELVGNTSFVNCCRYVAAAYYEVGNFDEFPLTAHALCCTPNVLPDDEFLGSFCSPWGPPVPPLLDAELEAAA